MCVLVVSYCHWVTMEYFSIHTLPCTYIIIIYAMCYSALLQRFWVWISAAKVLTANVMEETNEELSNFTVSFEDDFVSCVAGEWKQQITTKVKAPNQGKCSSLCLNYRMHGQSLPCHWIAKATNVICLTLQSLLANLRGLQFYSCLLTLI